MRVAVLGLGYVGFTVACCMASRGHNVTGVDVSEAKLDDIQNGIAPFQEPGLKDMMDEAQRNELLSVTKSVSEAITHSDLAIVCVGTPSGPDGAHDMRYIIDVTHQIARVVSESKIQKLTVAYRSTMRPGTLRKLIAPIFSEIIGPSFPHRIELVYNPEFLREATAIDDYFHPSKIVIGTENGRPSEIMQILHQEIKAPTFITKFEEAELTKFIDNSWHAVKVAFANEIGRVCQKMNISATNIHEIFTADTKLNISTYYTRPGGAFGGSCLPKDVRALQNIASEVGANLHLVDSLLRSNDAHKNHQFDYIMSQVSDSNAVLMVGLAFKANTDDLRESPNVDLARKLLNTGIDLKIFDPNLDPTKLRGQNLGYAYSNLPSFGQLLVSKQEAEAIQWDLVIINNATSELLNIKSAKIVNTNRIN